MTLNASELMVLEGFFYFIGNESLKFTHSQSESWCERQGGHLVSILSKQETDFIKQHIRRHKQDNFWIGLFSTHDFQGCNWNVDSSDSCQASPRKWQWTDDSDLDYINWEEDKPDDKDNKCARLINAGTWQNVNCYDMNKIICKFPDICRDNDHCINGQCMMATSNSTYCRCEKGYQGETCSNDIDECQDVVGSCGLNARYCNNIPGGYECLCREGWTGEACDEDIDECLSETCNHSNNCTNTQGSFHCFCDEGYTSATCDTDIDECEDAEVVCGTGYACINLDGSYNCSSLTESQKNDNHTALRIAFFICLAITITIYSIFAVLILKEVIARRQMRRAAYNYCQNQNHIASEEVQSMQQIDIDSEDEEQEETSFKENVQ